MMTSASDYSPSIVFALRFWWHRVFCRLIAASCSIDQYVNGQTRRGATAAMTLPFRQAAAMRWEALQKRLEAVQRRRRERERETSRRMQAANRHSQARERRKVMIGGGVWCRVCGVCLWCVCCS